MKTRFALVALSFIAVLTLTATPAIALSKSTATIGYDLSYPQCGKSISYRPAFTVVGVNGGLANTTNPCLVSQLTWATKGFGTTNQPKIQLYINTANPGAQAGSWPKDNTGPDGFKVHSPYGDCDGSDTMACAYQYGWNRAAEDAMQRMPDAAMWAGINISPSAYTWWLDVEKINSWQADQAKNAAVLEGMTDCLKSLGAKVGLYSTTAQWDELIGNVSSGSSLNGLPNWRPGAKAEAPAKSNCGLSPLTAGGYVTMTQFLSDKQDFDYSCSG